MLTAVQKQIRLMRLDRKSKGRRRGQALVEVALLGIFLALLLAGAVDFGRAFYTSVVVTNMAGEGAAFAALNPDQDQDWWNQYCSTLRPVPVKATIQERARRVAKDRGLVIERQDQNLATIAVNTDGYGPLCSLRCTGRTIVVTITYRMNDLFLPSALGMREILITKSASQQISRNPQLNALCP
ncbi:MAG TPA: TadE/TadG family type IV pilus assembly protein [Chloroflexia bacterium]|nr:TadE/TadG family type IV pilus assembly protein [Chloroflexia bacterium]